MLTRQQDYAYGQPSLTKKKLRRLELQAGAQRGKVKPGLWAANTAMRQAERDLARQAEIAYQRTVSDCAGFGTDALSRCLPFEGV
jgi:transposase